MAYIENPFRTGQVVRCIKDCSTVIVHSTNPALKGTVGAYPSPKEGNILTIDEVLGEYLRFDRYDDMECDGYNWWFYTNFRPLSEAEAYLVEEGLDLEEEIKYGKSVIERIRSRIATNGPQVVAVALHGPQPAVMGWPTPLETLGKCGKVKIIADLFGPFGTMPLYLGHQRKTTRHEPLSNPRSK